jgi:hypothetical protein
MNCHLDRERSPGAPPTTTFTVRFFDREWEELTELASPGLAMGQASLLLAAWLHAKDCSSGGKAFLDSPYHYACECTVEAYLE